MSKEYKESYRSSSLDEVQGYADLQMIWKYVRRAGKGKSDPIKPDARERIVKGLKRTMSEGHTARTRNVAAAMVLAIADGDWDRDVYRSTAQKLNRMDRTIRTEGQGSERAKRRARRRKRKRQDAGGDPGQING